MNTTLAAAEPAAESTNDPRPVSTPPEAKAFHLKAKGVALVIGALLTGGTALFGAIRKPEEKVAKEAYATLKDKVEKQDIRLQELQDDLHEVTGYLQAMKDARDRAGVPAVAPPMALAPMVPSARPAAPAAAPLPPVNVIVSKAEAK